MERVIDLLRQFVVETGKPLDIILVGAMALPFYHVKLRFTQDLDAEIKQGDIEELYSYLKAKGLESDLSENISGWSIISMPSGYRERSRVVYKDQLLTIRVLSPEDYIIMKLRRGTAQDIEDAIEVAIAQKVKKEDLEVLFEKVLKESIKDTALFNFRRIYQVFTEELGRKVYNQNRPMP
ncbi:conserved hypothetical protein [Hydrogenobacter thermophilus TK-6]|uniref:nucleotidyltransferase n=1 Tax=Hydrogenobacter thermophilus TaxID=940 RepID=UPI0001E65682|nr:nucleotidyltransferase [Hydrogenobacter thermophilus]ADO44822.1 conserved hypothetical protein [Hydrogenobacter thermophilus TK-6]